MVLFYDLCEVMAGITVRALCHLFRRTLTYNVSSFFSTFATQVNNMIRRQYDRWIMLDPNDRVTFAD